MRVRAVRLSLRLRLRVRVRKKESIIVRVLSFLLESPEEGVCNCPPWQTVATRAEGRGLTIMCALRIEHDPSEPTADTGECFESALCRRVQAALLSRAKWTVEFSHIHLLLGRRGPRPLRPPRPRLRMKSLRRCRPLPCPPLKEGAGGGRGRLRRDGFWLGSVGAGAGAVTRAGGWCIRVSIGA